MESQVMATPARVQMCIRDSIVDIEKEKNGMTEVEIVHGSISKDVMFTAEGAWAYTCLLYTSRCV